VSTEASENSIIVLIAGIYSIVYVIIIGHESEAAKYLNQSGILFQVWSPIPS